MTKTGIFVLSLCAGIVVGLLLGYHFFHHGGITSQSLATGPADTTDTHQYLYRLSDSLVVRHTISGSDTGVIHRVDTLKLEPK